MIKFYSVNSDDDIRYWEYGSAEEMIKEWYSDGQMVPPDDAPLFGVSIDGKKFEKKNMNFEDFVTTLIVEGGYADDEF